MIIQTVISQNNNEAIELSPNLYWGGSLSGDYPTIPNITYVTLFSPTIDNVDTYNHIAFVKECYGKIYVMYATSSKIEANAGQRVRLQVSSDYGYTWSEPTTLFEGMDDPSKDPYTELGRIIIPAGFVVIDGELYAIGDVTDTKAGAVDRVEVGEIVRKINSNDSFGTQYWIDNPDGTFIAPPPISGYPSFTFNTTLRLKIREHVKYNPESQPTRYYSVPIPDPLICWERYYDGNELVEPSVVELPNKDGYLKLWRALSGYTTIKIAQTSNDGVIWNDTFETPIPDSPSATKIMNVNNEVLIFGNNQGGVRSPLFLALSSDGFNYENNNIYNIDTETTGAMFPETYKNTGVAYPESELMSNGKIICVYSVNKEDIKCAIFNKPTLI